jgi:hypothetical protein
MVSRAWLATLDEVEMHRIALKSRVRLEAPRHLLSSQYLCGSSQPDTCHVVHEVSVQDTQGIGSE